MATEELEEKSYHLDSNDFFIRKTSGKFVITSVISTVSVFASSLIDTVLVGLFVGEEGLSAMSLISPVFLFYYTIGAAVGIGGSILASRILGVGEMDKYRKVFSCSTQILVIAALVMTVLAYSLTNPIVHALSGDLPESTQALVKDYLLFYFPGGAFTLLSYIPLYFLKTEGKPKLSSRLFTMSAVGNVIFSALFMSPLFNMGTGGASLATSISMGAVVIVGFIVMLRSKTTELKFVKKSVEAPLVREIVTAGLPNGMNNLLNSARILLINTLLMRIGAAMLLPCYTVLRNVSDLLNSVILGMSMAIVPLLGVFFGERDYQSARTVLRLSMKTGLLVMIPLIAIPSIFPKFVFGLFGIEDATVLSQGVLALPLALVGLIAAYANTLYIGFLTATHHEAVATSLTAMRLFVFVAASALPLAFTVGSYGIWASFSLSEGLTLLAFYGIRYVIRRKKPNLDALLLDTDKEKSSNITFSVRNNVEDIVYATQQISAFCEENDISMRLSMRISLAIEEILTFLNGHCLTDAPDSYTDVRVCRIDEEIMIRFRYVGKIYDPMSYYQNNEFNEELQEELLGLKMMMKAATLVDFRQTLGTNNLALFFEDAVSAKKL